MLLHAGVASSLAVKIFALTRTTRKAALGVGAGRDDEHIMSCRHFYVICIAGREKHHGL